jgi:hypothetical protein
MAWYDAGTKCIDCLAEQCRQWLEITDASGAPPDFWPNAQFLSGVRKEMTPQPCGQPTSGRRAPKTP